jgi:hypothetical protein
MKKLFLIIVTSILLVIQCVRQTTGPIQEEMSGEISMTMNLSSAPSEVSAISGYLSRVSHDTIFFNFTIVNNTASALVENIVHGNWKLTVNAFDSSGTIIYTGSIDVNVVPGVVTPVSLHLNPATGNLEITVTWGTQHNLDSLLIAYYSFSGNANDLSGNGNHGTVFGATLTADRWGNPNSAYSFDGVDDYIDIGNKAILKPDFPITFCTWVNLSAYGTANDIFTNNYDDDLYFGIWLNFTVDGLPCISYGNSGIIGPQSRRTKVGTTRFELNTWYHIAGIIYNNFDMDMYVNAVNDGGFYEGQAIQMAYSEGPGNIARKDASMYAPPTYLAGKLDEIYFYSRVLSEYEIGMLAR